MRKFKLAVVLSSIGVLMSACGSSASSSQPVSTKVPTISLTNSSKYGEVVVAPSGMVLYAFTADTSTKSNCSGACSSVWIPFVASKVSVASGLHASLISYVNRGGGKMQVAYDGHPLYQFVDDTTAGVATGEGLHSFGGYWYVVSSSGNPVTASGQGATATKTSTTSSSAANGYGY